MKDKKFYCYLQLIILILSIGLDTIWAYATIKSHDFKLVNISYNTETDLVEIVKKYDVWMIDPLHKKLQILASNNMLEALKSLGYHIEIDKVKTDRLKSLQFPLLGYRIVEQIYAEMMELENQYPDLVEVTDYGDSWGKVTPFGKEGYDLFDMKITNKNIPGRKPPIVIDGGIHAREMAPPEVVFEYGHYLLENYNIDPDISWLVAYREIHIIPMMNPDGRKLAELGYYWRKNTNNSDGCNDPNKWGVDLNRNYPFKWGVGEGSSTNPCSNTFRGRAPESEPEIYYYLSYVRKILPDQRGVNDVDASSDSTMGIYLNCHSHGNVILHPWGFTSNVAPNPELIYIARKMSKLSGYDYRSSLYPVNGVARD